MGRKLRLLAALLCVAAVLLAAAPAAAASARGAAPYDLEVSAPDTGGAGVLRLSWSVDDSARVARYTVYRSKDPATGFRRVFSDEADVSQVHRMDYFDAGLEEGSTYHYRVSLSDASGVVLGMSETASGRAPAAVRTASGGYAGKRIIISVYDQRIYFLHDEVLVKSHLCSTGTYDKPTPYGVFAVQFHSYLVISERYGGAYCYWWMNFAPDIGMHALPYNPSTRTYTGANMLGRRASHGCVRQGVADAQWAYNWAPNGTRIDVVPHHWEPPPPPPPPFKGGHAAQASRHAKEWYFAEGCTSGNFEQYVVMVNPTGAAANVSADFMKPDGSVVSRAHQVPPLSRSTIHVDAIPGLESTEVSTRLRSDQEITAERAMYFHDFFNSKEGGTCSAGTTEARREWFLAEGYTGGEFDLFVTVQNPGDADGTVGMDFMRLDGQSFHREWPIRAHSRLSVHVDDVPEVAACDVSTRITCDRPIVAERAQYFNYNGILEGNASAAVPEARDRWYLAEGYTGGQFDEYVCIQNPGADAGSAQVTFMCSDGTNVLRGYDLLRHSRTTIHIDEIPELANREVSTLVEADVDVIVERSMFFSYFGKSGGTDAPGVSESDRYWYLAEGYTGGDFDTFVVVMNPNDAASLVDISFLRPNGTQKGLSFTVGPRSRYTVHVDAVADMTNTEFASAITGELPIICERAMYFSMPR